MRLNTRVDRKQMPTDMTSEMPAISSQFFFPSLSTNICHHVNEGGEDEADALRGQRADQDQSHSDEALCRDLD